MFNLLEMMEILNGMNGEHEGSVCTGLAMEWLKKGCRKNPMSGFQCSADRPDPLSDRSDRVSIPVN